MKKIMQLSIFLAVSFVVVSAHATPLLHDVTLANDGYVIEDRSGDSSLDAWVSPDGYTGTDYTGLYLGTVVGNDDIGDLNYLIGYFLGDSSYEITGYEKYEYDENAASFSLDGGGDGNVTFVTDDGYSGTWTVAEPLLLDFYTVKSATEYALYFVDPALAAGLWTTRHLLTPNGKNIPEISHFTASVTPVPEPATMFLFGTGLIGLVGVSRRKKK